MKKTNSSINSMDMQEIDTLSKDKFMEREMNHNQNPVTTSLAPAEEVVEDKKTPTTPLTPSPPIIQEEKVMEEKDTESIGPYVERENKTTDTEMKKQIGVMRPPGNPVKHSAQCKKWIYL